jgi:hypothetical protein
MDELEKLQQVTISDPSDVDNTSVLSEKRLAELKLYMKSRLNDVNKWWYVKRIHAMVKFISKIENLSMEDQMIARMWVFMNAEESSLIYTNLTGNELYIIDTRLKQNPMIELILNDASQLDRLGAIGITRNPSLEMEDFVSIFDSIQTHTAKCIGKSRMKIIKEFLILKDMELDGADFYPQCDVCGKRSESDIDFLPCHHSFCSECFYGPFGTAHCTICDTTFYDELPNLVSQQVDFSK